MADESTGPEDSTGDYTEEDYKRVVSELSAITADELRAARGNPDAQRAALARYYKRGTRADLSSGELVDFLAISTPSILEKAGYSDDEADALLELSETLTEDELESFTIE